MVTISPIRDWTAAIGGGSYGLMQRNEGTSEVYVGKFFCHLPMSPPVAAVALSLFALLVVIALTARDIASGRCGGCGGACVEASA
jgi:hypothetical protein